MWFETQKESEEGDETVKALATSAEKKVVKMTHRENDILLVVKAFIVRDQISCSDGQRDRASWQKEVL